MTPPATVYCQECDLHIPVEPGLYDDPVGRTLARHHDEVCTGRAALISWLSGEAELFLIDTDGQSVPTVLVVEDEDALTRLAIAWRARDEEYPDPGDPDPHPETCGLYRCSPRQQHTVQQQMRTHFLLGAAAYAIDRFDLDTVANQLPLLDRGEELEHTIARARGALTLARAELIDTPATDPPRQAVWRHRHRRAGIRQLQLSQLTEIVDREARRSLYFHPIPTPAEQARLDRVVDGSMLVEQMYSPVVQRLLETTYRDYVQAARNHRHHERRAENPDAEPVTTNGFAQRQRISSQTRTLTLRSVLEHHIAALAQTITSELQTPSDRIAELVLQAENRGDRSDTFLAAVAVLLRSLTYAQRQTPPFATDEPDQAWESGENLDPDPWLD